MICDGERDPADFPSLTHDDRERHHKADSMFIENREVELCETLGLLGIRQRADAQKKREPPSVAAMAFEFIVVSSSWLSVERTPEAVAVSSCVLPMCEVSGPQKWPLRFRGAVQAALLLNNRGPSRCGWIARPRRSVVHSVRRGRSLCWSPVLPDGMYSSNRYALDAHTFLHLLTSHVCVCLLFRLKGDVHHFVFFVHQEHGGIAFG